MRSGHLGGLEGLAFHPSLELRHSLASLEFLAIQADLEDPEYLALRLVLGSLFYQGFLHLVGLCPRGNRGAQADLFHPLAHVDQVILDFHLTLVSLAGLSLEAQHHPSDLEVQEGLAFHPDLPFLP